jgi:two-component system LytT family response regulator
MKIRALIVDDESLVRNRIRRYLRGEPDIEIIGECADGMAAEAALRNTRPDLLFLDIQMPGMTGFQVIEAVTSDKMPVTIFVTAHEEFALRAFETHALDYLLKPFRQERFREALCRARTYLQGNRNAVLQQQMAGLLESLSQEFRREPRLAVKSDGRVLFLGLDEIDWVEAVGDYVNLHVGQQKHLVRARMAEMEKKLAADRFCRIHRSTIVNLDSIKELLPFFGGQAVVILKNGDRLTVSRNSSQKLQYLMGADS